MARALRQGLNYKINQKEKEDREYHTLEYDVIRPIYSFDPEKGEVKIVKRQVSAYTIECISGGRKIYQYLKKKWYNRDLEANFAQLPELSELEDIATKIAQDTEIKEIKQANAEVALPKESEDLK